ncbi:hypothetical protein GCM10011514_41100 [Emticicia aquatilis]|uniref:Uncharacterized protein n=1 Tax=Emticicia aquatilis TaxID=1537369 RepID=A0A917DW18_9BACT|nr:hypothetical protein [Emticicia aquatilis]GGD72788.1 hypothetical protein GCM10011514_41100 [Emticicia aquatilis]
MKKINIALSLFLIILVCQSCWLRAAKEALGIARDVKDLIALGTEIVEIMNEFSEQSNEFVTNVNEIQTTAVTGFNEGKPTNDIAIFWEGEWKGIHSKYDDLRTSLNAIDVKTNSYFEELTKNNLSISDSTLRKTDAEQNLQLREKYNIERQKAIEGLDKAQEMLKKGDDLNYVLRNQVLRSAVEQNIQVINEIALQAKGLTESIQSFTTNCKPLFQTN